MTTLSSNTSSGALTVAGGVGIAGSVYAGGNVNTPGLTITSDYRIKTNIIKLNETYTVDNLKPVTYYNKLINKEDIGLIADQVQQHYPILVDGEKDGDQNQSINYIGIIPILINEIQNLKSTVNKLTNKVETLEQIIEKMA
jgi:hypothetical protein